MNISSNTFRSSIIFVLLNCVIIDAYSISISARRLYLDPKSNSTHIRVLNLDTQAQRCEVSMKDVVINNLGNIELTPKGEVTENSAKPLIRLAPRRFTLGINDNQLVKLLYRRKPGVKNGEYHGVLAIKCKDKIEKNGNQVSVTAALVHNVPVIVRTGRMPIKASFLSTKINNNNLQFGLKIEGQRSITGNLTLTNPTTEEVVFERKQLSIYAQHPVITLEFPLGKYQNGPLLLTFTEDSNFGGELIIEQSVK